MSVVNAIVYEVSSPATADVAVTDAGSRSPTVIVVALTPVAVSIVEVPST